MKNLRVGIYKEGGRQIGQFSSKDNDYNPPGYSTLPTVKADENGNATTKVNAKVLGKYGRFKDSFKLGDKTFDYKQTSNKYIIEIRKMFVIEGGGGCQT